MTMRESSEESVALELLAKLVAIDSINPVYGGPGEAAVAGFVSDWLSARGIEHERQPVTEGRYNIVARIGQSDWPALLLEAHMDTVGVDGWAQGNAHELIEIGERFYGRGSCDTKASLVCFLLTLERFAKEPENLGRALVFAATVDEESEQVGAYALGPRLKDLGVECAITGEPTKGDVIARHKGIGRYVISCRGKAAHASTPDLGTNAIYAAARICQALEAHAGELDRRPRSDDMERGTLNVGVIKGGYGFNVVPDACILDVDRRIGTKETAAGVRAEIEAICRSEVGTGLEVFIERPALRGQISGAFVSGLLSAGKRVGEEMKQRDVPYMTNAVAYEEVGIPAVVFGPGDIAQAHKNDEFIERGEISRCLRILDGFLRKA